MARRFFLGFDGGGTKTECVLLDDAGRVAAETRAGPANPVRAGYDRAFASLREAARQALAVSGAGPEEVAGVYAGLAGAGRKDVSKRIEEFLRAEFPNAAVQVTTDAMVALEAATDGGPGMIVIAGTGSVVLGRNAKGDIARAGGYGPWIGDEGSGLDIGRRAVAAVARARDEVGPPTRLSELVLSAAGAADWPELASRIAAEPLDLFPRLCPCVVEAAQDGDAVAREILEAAAGALAAQAASVVRRLALGSEEFTLAKSGGVHGHSEIFDGALDGVLRQAAPRARIGRLQISPAAGAARMAMRSRKSADGAQT
jgi:N-acetylglucosamine kinase-like BadF-type ATPase